MITKIQSIDLIRKILSFLKFKELIQLFTTCKFFYNTVTDVENHEGNYFLYSGNDYITTPAGRCLPSKLVKNERIRLKGKLIIFFDAYQPKKMDEFGILKHLDEIVFCYTGSMSTAVTVHDLMEHIKWRWELQKIENIKKKKVFLCFRSDQIIPRTENISIPHKIQIEL